MKIKTITKSSFRSLRLRFASIFE